MIYKKVNLLSKKESQKLLSELEKSKNKFVLDSINGETKYAAYESNLVKDFPHIHQYLKKIIENKNILPNKKYKVVNSFDCRYSTDTSSSMPYHYDIDDFTILIYLNDDFTGGGTHFPFIKKTFTVKDFGVGNALLFSGDNIKSWHGALPIESGIRYTISVRVSKEKILNIIFKTFILYLFSIILNKYKSIYSKIKK